MTLPEQLTIAFLNELNTGSISISPRSIDRVAANRVYLEDVIAKGKTVYGINTGFGSLCNVKIASEELAQLQENLVCSHACGMGDEVPKEIVRIMLLLKAFGLSQGYSGVRPALVARLVWLYNNQMLPAVYELGSLGASGDLAPLAHLSLPIIGKGMVDYNGRRLDTPAALQLAQIAPLALAAKEGLALLNGTQFMSAYLVWSLIAAERLSNWADAIAAMSADAFYVKDDPFQEPLQRVRPYEGQKRCASRMLALLQGSDIQKLHKEQVQDPYSFRCIPQVHGATRDVIETVKRVVEIEMNAVTDNPIVFHDDDLILSGGNFHGQPLALHADFLAIALSELAAISERRTYLLVSGQRGLPPFLAPDAGLNSGFMIAQYTAAAIVSQNKQLCTPASVDSIVSSNGQEDHVSMGANAVTKLRKVVLNVQRVLAIELLTAAQALDLRQPNQSSSAIASIHRDLRNVISFMPYDRVLHDDLVKAVKFLDSRSPELPAA